MRTWEVLLARTTGKVYYYYLCYVRRLFSFSSPFTSTFPFSSLQLLYLGLRQPKLSWWTSMGVGLRNGQRVGPGTLIAMRLDLHK